PIGEFFVEFRMSEQQVAAEGEEKDHRPRPLADGSQPSTQHVVEPRTVEHHRTADHHQLMHSHRATTGTSLAMRAANLLAQAEDLILFNGQNAYANSPLFLLGSVQTQFQTPQASLGTGLLRMNAAGDVDLDPRQVVVVHPTVPAVPAPAP